MTVHYPRVDESAPCRSGDADRFWPTKHTNRTALLPVLNECSDCAFKEPCLRWALLHEMDGIWAGTTATERRAIRRRLGIVCAAPYMSVDHHPRNELRRRAS